MVHIKNTEELEQNQGVLEKLNEKCNGVTLHPSLDNYIAEGIVFDEKKRTVKLNDSDDGVVFLENEHLVYKYGNLKVYSILKRTFLMNERGKNVDGNPFTYALKKKYGWSFDISDSDIIKYVRKFLSACNSLNVEYDIIVMCPTHSGINERFMKIISKQVNAKNTVNDYFCKTKTDYILDFGIDYDKIAKENSDYLRDKIYREIYQSVVNMGEFFESGKMDKKYMKYINGIVSLTNKYTISEALEMFKDKRVLVLDDVMASGSTVSECVRAIQKYEPLVVDVITLLSKKFPNKPPHIQK